MADMDKKINDNEYTVDAKLFKRPSVLVPKDEDKKKEEKTKPEGNPSPIDVISNSSVKSTATMLSNKRKLRSTTYEMEKFHEHAMLVLNHKEVKGYKPRFGTEKDVKALHGTFSKFGFKVEVKTDLKRDQVMKKLIEFCGRDFSECGCVVVVVLSHGRENGDLYSSDGLMYCERDIIEYLKHSNNLTLVGKPKILIIQACRAFDSNISVNQGVRVNSAHGAESTGEGTSEADPAKPQFKHYFLPVESNMLVVHSSYLGKFSFRNELKGSWFIQELCKKINKLAQSLDLESILTEMKREVAVECNSEVYNKADSSIDILKQMPVTISTLTKKIYLRHREKSAMRHHTETCLGRLASGVQPSQEDENLALAELPPSAPLLFKYGPCFCFLDRYNYMLNCLRCYLKDHPDDEAAKLCYDLTSEYEHGQAFYGAKVKMLKTISACLNKTTFKYHKYVHLYN